MAESLDILKLTEQLCSPAVHLTEVLPLPSLQVFQVNADPFNVLNVTVLEAHKVTKGWVGDLVDKPDPYVVLNIPGSPSGRKKTTHFNNTSSPTWNESFSFSLEDDKSYMLEITLMDANYTVDQKLGCEKISLVDLELNEEKIITVKFGKVTEISLQLLLQRDENTDLRYGLSLCDKEKEFRSKRSQFVLQTLKDLFPENYPLEESDVPIVSIIGSGGGFRAMTGLGGAMKALCDTKILDCATYTAGLSGSAWYLSTLYSHPEFPEKSPGELLEELKSNVRHSPFWLLSPRSMYRYISSIKEKHKKGQPVSFTDFFGYLLGDTLLKGRCGARLSDQQETIAEGKAPLPLYTCLHVKSNVSAKVFQDWIEFSPYEIGIAKYATFLKADDFGCKFFKGRIMKRFTEYPLHYLQGVWGSAFSILFRRLIQERTKLSIDLNAHSHENIDEETEEETFFDAEEEFQIEEDTLRDALGNLDLSSDDSNEINSESEEESPEESCSEKHRIPSVWKEFVNNICSTSLLDTRKGRAGRILNPLRGLSLVPCFSLSPPTSICNDDALFKGLTEPASTDSKTLYLVDGGLTFNLPFPLLIRSQRSVDIHITFDFSSREADHTAPFKELLLSEKWARINNLLFPPIHDLVLEYMKQPPKECYVFKHPTNEFCPIIIHFPLINMDFRKFKEPGVPRETEEELEFANFNIFSDPKKTYSIFNFKYPPKKFDRLAKLMEFNVKNNINIVMENLSDVISRKKEKRLK
ncbi:cytosolic phospholipase A2 isoform X1 [Parasteatoda tepidariorum]|uniref:cytosolic phospholipase A2 isoform X1 n=1 Tax=Parasteatoda tepidariorum TaxID=114398 RepID=UPI0039BD838E